MSKAKAPTFNLEALSRIDSRDMLVLQDTAAKVMADMARFASVDPTTQAAGLEATSREALLSAYGFSERDEEERKPFVYQDGVAVIPIHGTLLNRCNYSWGFVTGYQYIRRMLNAALDDDDVDYIVFDVDSPGGEAAGCFELAYEIMASRRVKDSLAMIDSLSASGGIALSSCATRSYAIPSARIGSIGVYKMHISYEEAMKNEGIKVTFATAGDHKVDGNPYQDLPDSVLNEWRESAGKTWDDFIALVAEARKLPEEQVRETQARIYRSDEALAKGLIDAVKTPTEAVAAFLAELADEPSFEEDEEEIEMADIKKEVTSGMTEADFTRIGSMIATTVAGALSGLTRSQSIKDYGASKGKAFTALAATLAADENISVESAKAAIDAAAGTVPAPVKKAKGKAKVQVVADPEDEDDELEGDEAEDGDEDEAEEREDGDDDEADEQQARASRKGKDRVNHFDRVMKQSKQPKVGGGKVKSDGDDAGGGRSKVNPLLADHAKITGADWSMKAAKAAN